MHAILASVTRDGNRALTSADRRRILAFAVFSAIMLVGSGAVRVTAPSPFAPRVHIRWVAGISDAQRAELERRFALTEGRRREDATWEYDLIDRSPSTVRALVAHAAVEDTHYLDRASGQVAVDAPPGTSRLSERWLAGWIHSSLFEWFMLLWVSSLVVSGVWLASAADAQRT